MKQVLVIGAIATLILLPTSMVLAMKPHQTVVQAPQVAQLNADVIFDKVNYERTQRGLKPLVRDARLDATAQAKADEMVKLNYFGHYNPTTGKNSAWDNPIFNQLCSASSENISMTVLNETGDFNVNTVTSWMNSKSHHDAILLPDYTLTGVAISKDKIVQHFCIAK